MDKILRSFGKRRITITIFLVTVFSALWLFVSFFNFTNGVRQQADEINIEQLQNIAIQNANAVSQKLDSSFQIITATSAAFSVADNPFSEESIEMLNSTAVNSDFNIVRVTRPDGLSYASSSDTINISQREYFTEAMNGKAGIFGPTDSLANGKPIMVFYAPLYSKESIIGSLHATYEVERLSNITNFGSFEMLSTGHVFNRNGQIIVGSNDIDSGNNLWSFFEGFTMHDGYSIEKIKSDVKDSKAGTVYFDWDGDDFCGYYTPTDIMGWYVICYMPLSSARIFYNSIIDDAIFLVISTIVLPIVLFIAFLLFLRRSNSALRDANRKIRLNNERYKIAVSHASSYIFEYNLSTDSLSFQGEMPKLIKIPENVPNVMAWIEAQEIVDINSFTDFRKLFLDIRKGNNSVCAIVKLWTIDPNRSEWFRISMTAVTADNNSSDAAVGTMENVSDIIKVELRYSQEERYRRSMIANSMRVYEINLTHDRFMRLDSSGAGVGSQSWRPYSKSMQDICDCVVHPDDRARFMSIASRDALLSSFEHGITEFNCKYRYIDNGNEEYTWSMSTTHVMCDPASGDAKCFTYVKDISEQTEIEQELRAKAEQQSIGGVYTFESAKELIGSILSVCGPDVEHALLCVDIVNLFDSGVRYGDPAGEKIFALVSECLFKLTRADDVVARIDSNMFLIFLREIRSHDFISDIATRLCSGIENISFKSNEKQPLSVKIGISFFPGDGMTFDILYDCSGIALYHCKRSGDDCYTFYDTSLSKRFDSQETASV